MEGALAELGQGCTCYTRCVSRLRTLISVSYESDAEAYAAKSGLCVDDEFTTGAAPFLYMYAYGTCLPSSSLWNEAHVSGDFRDPGLDGYSTNTVIMTGAVIGRWNGGSHCDGWVDVWVVSNSGCP